MFARTSGPRTKSERRTITDALFGVAFALLIAGPAMSAVPPDIVPSTKPVAFTSVNVISMTSDVIDPDRTVIVRDGFIDEIGPSATTDTSGTTVIDATGLYLMPGLADLHTHLGGEVTVDGGIGENQLLVYLAGGVTTILNEGDFMFPFGRTLIPLATATRNGVIPGPTVYTASYARGAADGGTSQQLVSSFDDGVAHVMGSKAAGYDYIKIYNNTPAAALTGIFQQAATDDMRVIGHFPFTISAQQALQDGIAMVAHGDAYYHRFMNGSTDPALVTPAINATLASGASVNTTLYIIETVSSIWCHNNAAFQAFISQPQMRYVHPDEVEVWRRGFEGARWSPGGCSRGALNAQFNYLIGYIKDFHDAGVRLTLGTDSPTVLGAPGFSAHQEMRLLSDAGLNPFEVLSIATRNGGSFINETVTGSEPFGTVEVGMRADLLLLNSNPLAILANAQDRAGVMTRGNWYSAAELARRLEAVGAEYDVLRASRPMPAPGPSGGGGGSVQWLVIILLSLALVRRRP